MNKYDIKDRVYAINKNENHIERGIIRKIIIEDKKISYELEITGYNTFHSEIFVEDLISRNTAELYQYLKDNIEKFFPLV